MASLQDFVCYDHLLHQPLAERGWSVSTIDWRRDDTPWHEYEAVIIRSPWDYQHDPELFLARLDQIVATGARLENSRELVRWNIRKTYLRELEEQGIGLVPTLWGDRFDTGWIDHVGKLGDPDELVIKPQVSANADDTYRLAREKWDDRSRQLARIFEDRPCMLQACIPAITEEGEYSLFYFGGNYSHAILKSPRAGDFRVQEEHGGRLQSVTPEPALRRSAEAVLQAIARTRELPLYARIDLVRHQGRFLLMEVELIEPSLYFNMDEQSAARFADAFVARMATR